MPDCCCWDTFNFCKTIWIFSLISCDVRRRQILLLPLKSFFHSKHTRVLASAMCCLCWEPGGFWLCSYHYGAFSRGNGGRLLIHLLCSLGGVSCSGPYCWWARHPNLSNLLGKGGSVEAAQGKGVD